MFLPLLEPIPKLCAVRENSRQLFNELSRPWGWCWIIKLAHTNPNLINSIVPSHYLLAQPWRVAGAKDKKLYPKQGEQLFLFAQRN
jgi:hypothetical protein